jgi:hypothetical protein
MALFCKCEEGLIEAIGRNFQDLSDLRTSVFYLRAEVSDLRDKLESGDKHVTRSSELEELREQLRGIHATVHNRLADLEDMVLKDHRLAGSKILLSHSGCLGCIYLSKWK